MGREAGQSVICDTQRSTLGERRRVDDPGLPVLERLPVLQPFPLDPAHVTWSPR